MDLLKASETKVSYTAVPDKFYPGLLDEQLPDRGEADRVLRVGGDGGAGQRHARQA